MHESMQHIQMISEYHILIRANIPKQIRSKKYRNSICTPSLGSQLNEQLLVQNNFRAKILVGRFFQSIVLNDNTLVMINNTNEKNCCYFTIEKRSGNIIYCNKTLKIVVCGVTFFYNFDVTSLQSSHKPGVARGERIWFNFPVNKKTKHE